MNVRCGVYSFKREFQLIANHDYTAFSCEQIILIFQSIPKRFLFDKSFQQIVCDLPAPPSGDSYHVPTIIITISTKYYLFLY